MPEPKGYRDGYNLILRKSEGRKDWNGGAASIPNGKVRGEKEERGKRKKLELIFKPRKEERP